MLADRRGVRLLSVNRVLVVWVISWSGEDFRPKSLEVGFDL
jgi:hypothetical protein